MRVRRTPGALVSTAVVVAALARPAAQPTRHISVDDLMKLHSSVDVLREPMQQREQMRRSLDWFARRISGRS